jgi:hypothetical protein
VRRGAPFLLLLATALTIFFAAPAWFLENLLPAGTNISWARYADAFRSEWLWPVITLVAVRLGLSAAVHFNTRWSRPTEGIRLALWICFVGALGWIVFNQTIFSVPQADLAFKIWLLIFLTINAIQIVVHVRRVVTRVLVAESRENAEPL